MARETTTDLAVLQRLLSPAGRDVADIGCGPGALVRDLAALGARVTGIEVSEDQLRAARAQPAPEGARYEVGRAEALPLADASLDIAIFMRSLHHVPMKQHAAALAECRRVLRPGGVVYVAEPLPEGDFFTLTSLVEDEREVRAAAQRTIAAASGFWRPEPVEYDVVSELPDPAALRRRIVGAEPARAPVFDARAQDIAEVFARLGEPLPGGGRRFRQPMRADRLTLALR